MALTNEGGIVFDPFMGVGSTLLAALIHKRKGMGVDKEKEYIDIALKRINDFQNGVLKKRPLGKAVYKPTGKEKVSQIPSEWKQTKIGDVL